MYKVDLKPHNEQTMEKIVEFFKTSNKCCAIQATGTGKTFLILRLLEMFQNEDKSAVIFAPNREIIKQTKNKMKKYEIDNAVFYTYQKLSRMSDDEMNVVYSSKSFADSDKLTDEEKESIKSKVEEIKKWIDENQNATKEEYDKKYDEFIKFTSPFSYKIYGNGKYGEGMPDMSNISSEQMAEAFKNMPKDSLPEDMKNMKPEDIAKMAEMFKKQQNTGKESGIKVEDVD